METLASEHTSSFLYASQYIVPHSEQHCRGMLYRTHLCWCEGRGFEGAQHLQQHVGLEHAFNLLHEQLQGGEVEGWRGKGCRAVATLLRRQSRASSTSSSSCNVNKSERAAGFATSIVTAPVR
jgi:hypothetical protein